ncbi:MAG: nucleotidyltransferase family protein [Candidatus Gygaella obscura]|nr:nucleotidyltransferase family protein [Candidatus Gygaella obscura]
MKKNYFIEEDFLLKSLSFNLDPENSKNPIPINNSINWKKVLNLAKIHYISPLIYNMYKNLGSQSNVPKEVFIILQNYYFSNLKKNLTFKNELVTLITGCKKNNLTIIPFRGFSLICSLYKDPALRIMNDIDILITKDIFQDIKTILLQNGFQQMDSIKEKRDLINDDKEILFLKKLPSGINIPIELHSNIAPPRPNQINLPLLYKNAYEEEMYDTKIITLSTEDCFLSLALHLRRHTRRLRLIMIFDIAKLIKNNLNNINWQYIYASAKKNRILNTVYLALYLVQELFKIKIPYSINSKFKPSILTRLIIKTTINKNTFFYINKRNGTLLRFLLFDNLIDFIFYLYRKTTKLPL